jgi:hypothetical protein
MYNHLDRKQHGDRSLYALNYACLPSSHTRNMSVMTQLSCEDCWLPNITRLYKLRITNVGINPRDTLIH